MQSFTDRQRDFLNAAIKIVSEDGLNKLTIRNVAAVVGVTEPAVYRHFPNKLALLSAMLEDLQSALLPHFQTLLEADLSSRENFSRFIYGLFDEFKQRPAYAPFIFSEEILNNEPQLRDKLQQVLKENIGVLKLSFEALQIDKKCRIDIAPEQLALLTLASIRLAVGRWHMNAGALRLKDLADELIETLGILFEFETEARRHSSRS